MQACEQCRLHNDITDYVLENLTDACRTFSTVNCDIITEVADAELESEIIEFILSSSLYGQVLISQFVRKFIKLISF